MEAMTQSSESPPKKRRLFFVLSGEHTTLPAAEVEAILESTGFGSATLSRSYRLLILEAPEPALKMISERSLMYDSCGVVLGECNADLDQIHQLVRNLPIEDLTRDSESFAVRSVRLGGVNKTLRRVDLERSVGSFVKQKVPRAKVRLSNPDLTFACIIFETSFLMGISSYSKPSGLIAPRRPRKRPVFHPSTMPPKIARCMVNLARASPPGTFLDPFAGVGGISIEAAVIGCNVVAVDASLRMLRGTRKNFNHFGLEALGLLNGDARHAPIHDLDAIATDPPYGRESSTMGAKASNLISDFLAGAGGCLKSKSHLCICSPVEIPVEDYARESGLKMREKHLAKVHRSLTRQFVVLQNA